MRKRDLERARSKFDDQLAQTIRDKRAALGLSQADLAARVPGWCQATISHWESQFARPNAYNVAQLAKALQCELSELLPEVSTVEA